MRGGWVGSDVWDKVPNKYIFFLTPSLIVISFLLLIFNNFQEQSSSQRAILADASQDAIMSPNVGTDFNL